MTMNTRCFCSMAFALSILLSTRNASAQNSSLSPMLALDNNVTKQLAELTASDGTASFYFGYGTAVSGNTAVVGALNASFSQLDQGAAYVFVKPIGGWTNTTQVAELIASDAASSSLLGYSAAISGNTIVVGAPDHGAVYVYVKPKRG